MFSSTLAVRDRIDGLRTILVFYWYELDLWYGGYSFCLETGWRGMVGGMLWEGNCWIDGWGRSA